MKTLWLLRHPPVEASSGLCYGRLDLDPVSDWEQRFGFGLADLPSTAPVVTSPARRCRLLADYLARGGRAVQVDKRWQELDFGDWEGRSFDELPRAQLDRWAETPWCFRPPGGEAIEALVERVDHALHVLGERPEPELIVVAHAGPLRVALGRCRKLPDSRWLDIEVPHAQPQIARLSFS